MLADRHPVMRLGYKGLFCSTKLQVVGETGGSEEALKLPPELRPDFVVRGLNIVEDMDGITLYQRIKSSPSSPQVLVVVPYNFGEDLHSLFLAGADVFLHENADHECLLSAARKVAGGETRMASGETGPGGGYASKPHLTRYALPSGSGRH